MIGAIVLTMKTRTSAKHQVVFKQVQRDKKKFSLFNFIEMFLENYLFLSNSLYLIGLFGIILNRRNIIILLMSVELILLGCNLNLIIFSYILDDVMGQVFALLVLTVAAAESAVGLAILVIYFRVRGNIQVEQSSIMRS